MGWKYWYITYENPININEFDRILKFVEWFNCFEIIDEIKNIRKWIILITFKNPHTFEFIIKLIPYSSITFKVESQLKKDYLEINKKGKLIYEKGKIPNYSIYENININPIKKIINEEEKVNDNIDNNINNDINCKCFWIKGKLKKRTSQIIRLYANNINTMIYNKTKDNLWDGYKNYYKIILLEDINPEICNNLLNYIKLWSNNKSFYVKDSKYNEFKIIPNYYFIITSNYSINESFNNQNDIEEFKIKFNYIDLDNEL